MEHGRRRINTKRLPIQSKRLPFRLPACCWILLCCYQPGLSCKRSFPRFRGTRSRSPESNLKEKHVNNRVVTLMASWSIHAVRIGRFEVLELVGPTDSSMKSHRVGIEERCAHAQQEQFGTVLYNSCHDLPKTSTRCETGALLVAVTAETLLHAASDSLSTVRRATSYAEHRQERREAKRHTTEEAMILGGQTSCLHRRYIRGKGLSLLKDGYIWKNFCDMISTSRRGSFQISKVKWHATIEMCQRGEVKCDDRLGNQKPMRQRA